MAGRDERMLTASHKATVLRRREEDIGVLSTQANIKSAPSNVLNS